MQSFQKHLKTIVDAKFGERTECFMGDSELENHIKVYVFIFSCFSKSHKINLDQNFFLSMVTKVSCLFSLIGSFAILFIQNRL